MNRISRSALILGAATLLALTGCSATSAEPEALEPEIPRVEVGPVLLTDEEAGERYLSMVCQLNVVGEATRQALIAGEDEFLNGGEPAVDVIQASSAEEMRLTRLAIEIIDDDYYTWPESVESFIPHIRSNYMAELGPTGAMANAPRYEDAYYTTSPTPTPEQQSAAQEIRYQLGLDADTTSSCVGHETALEALHTEMVKFNEELAAQEKRDTEAAESE